MSAEGDPKTWRQTPKHHRHGHQDHPGLCHMAADFRPRFWISLVLALPLPALSPLLQDLFDPAGMVA